MNRIATLALAGCCVLAPFAAAAQESDWRKELGTFRIGIVAPGGSREIAGVSDIRDAFSAALGVPVDVFAARDYLALIDAQATGRVDYAAYSALAFVAAVRHCACVEPLAAPVAADGATGLRAVVLRRAADDPGDGPDRIAVADAPALGPLAGLDVAGMPGGPAEVTFETAEQALAAFADGSVTGLAGYVLNGPQGDIDGSGTMALLRLRGIDPQSVAVAWKGPVMRFGPHAVVTSLNGEAKAILRTFLAGLAGQRPELLDVLSPTLQGGFQPVQRIDYATAGEVLDRVLPEAAKKKPAGG